MYLRYPTQAKQTRLASVNIIVPIEYAFKGLLRNHHVSKIERSCRNWAYSICAAEACTAGFGITCMLPSGVPLRSGLGLPDDRVVMGADGERDSRLSNKI